MQIFRPATAGVKINQISYVIFQTPVNVSSNIASRFSVMTRNFSVIFYLKRYVLWSKRAHYSAAFETLECWVKIRLIPHVIFQSTSQFLLKFCIILQCYDT